MNTKEELLVTTNLVKHFPLKGTDRVVHAVDGVNLTLNRGETLSVVGESGCGKSTLARLCIHLLEPTGGTVHVNGHDLTSLSSRELQADRRQMQLVFQDPFASLNPRRTVAQTLIEPMVIHNVGTHAERRARMQELLETVGLKPEMADRYPHEFSGGQRQRIGIARAIALRPELVVLDEPVSALDVSIQSQILNLLVELRERMALTYMFISHDLAVVKHISDRVAVMYLGQIVETAHTDGLYDRPLHPYTRALLSAIPVADMGKRARRTRLGGDIPDPSRPPEGCRFCPRCPQAMDRCKTEPPRERNLGTKNSPHYVRCHLYND
ncbi:ABC transporter ATP-binding protein [Pseudodesulfovibrio portus]|uniref:ABC transporter ATP-binding protein n=1 Tax=Pseudodesulfovibrio portus TaxID=231439 RepID=A0ABN6RZG7_9BACT|nr:oligopeptide/dipeptide ABC transporter ATP-binding protein [Pseudodesulfovibrio portus]BDQ35028.1 ABC transporter ATP-binding protein [Pseudodesulfovibrio portus]